MIHSFKQQLRLTRLRASVLALFAVLAGTNCDGTNATDPTAAASLTPEFATLSFSGVPYGPSGLAGTSSVSLGPSMFTGRQVLIDAGGVVNLINAARAENQRIVLALTGGSSRNYTTNGKFDITKWKKKMSTFNTSTIRNAIASAVSAGIVVGNTMIDEPE